MGVGRKNLAYLLARGAACPETTGGTYPQVPGLAKIGV